MKSETFLQLFHLEETKNGFIAAKNENVSSQPIKSTIPVLDSTRGAAKTLAGESKTSEGRLSTDGSYSYVKGARIRGKWIDGAYYTGTIMTVTEFGEFKVLFDDGDSLILPYHHLKPPKLRPEGETYATDNYEEEEEEEEDDEESDFEPDIEPKKSSTVSKQPTYSLKPPNTAKYSLQPPNKSNTAMDTST